MEHLEKQVINAKDAIQKIIRAIPNVNFTPERSEKWIKDLKKYCSGINECWDEMAADDTKLQEYCSTKV